MKRKAMETEKFRNLPETEIHVLKIEILGQKPLWFKSKDHSKLTKKIVALEELYGEEKLKTNEVEWNTQTYICKDTNTYYDINGTMDSIGCFKGEYL